MVPTPPLSGPRRARAAPNSAGMQLAQPGTGSQPERARGPGAPHSASPSSGMAAPATLVHVMDSETARSFGHRDRDPGLAGLQVDAAAGLRAKLRLG